MPRVVRLWAAMVVGTRVPTVVMAAIIVTPPLAPVMPPVMPPLVAWVVVSRLGLHADGRCAQGTGHACDQHAAGEMARKEHGTS